MNTKPTYEELERQVHYLRSELQKHKSTGHASFNVDFLKLAEQSQDMIYYYRVTSRQFSFLNSSSAAFFGFRQKDAIRFPAGEILRRIHPDDLQKVRAAQLKSFIPGSSEGEVEYRFNSPLQGWRWLHDKWIVVKDASEKPVAIIGIARDETSRKEAEDRLRQSEAFYRSVIDLVGTAIILAERDMMVSLVNRKIEELTGYEKGEIEGAKSWIDLIAKEDIEKIEDCYSERKSEFGSLPWTCEFRMVHKSGRIKYVVASVDVVPDTDKRIFSILDLTELKRIEHALKKSESGP